MPDGTSKPCWRCQAVRLEHEHWDERHPRPRPSTVDRKVEGWRNLIIPRTTQGELE